MTGDAGRSFVHLHNHTQYSLLDGASRIEEILDRAVRYGMPAVAITDHGNLFGVPRFYQKAVDSGVKPILGCEVYVAPGDRRDQTPGPAGKAPYHHLTLLAEDRAGYGNLMRLVSIGYLEGFYYRPRIDKETLARHGRGLIGLSGCLSGEIPRHLQDGRMDLALRSAGEYVDILGRENFFLELQDHGIPEQRRIFSDTVEMGRRLDLPLAATNDCHFVDPGDHFAHDVLICIQTGKTVNDPARMTYAPGHHFRPPEEMWRIFAGVPEAAANTVRIADRCHCTLESGGRHLPRFDVPAGMTVEDYFRQVVEAGYRSRERQWEEQRRGGAAIPGPEVYRRRLSEEIDMICRMGFPGYFLIVWDFVRFARENGIPVGPGRGSAAGSLVAYCLQITDIDPLPYGLLFERFLNPERVTLPDIDIDFC
ncbi:MAG: DNA polymerase III subunit alpha, partial [Acidobacteria bacterium]|nr:DNA polymerase III subunit alpha [Acidobacteriota bacterium]